MRMRMPVTKRPKLSATTTPKLLALWFQSAIDAVAAPRRPMTPSGPIGIRSSFTRNASAVIAAIAAAVTQAIGTTAFREASVIYYSLAGPHLHLLRLGTPPPAALAVAFAPARAQGCRSPMPRTLHALRLRAGMAAGAHLSLWSLWPL